MALMQKKKEEIQIPVNAGLLANITPIGIEFERNALMLGENYCRIYGIVSYPSECDYGWYAKLTNIAGTIVSINYEPIDNGTLMGAMSRNIKLNRGQAAASKDPLEQQRCQKAADDQERIMYRMDQNNEVMGYWNTTIMVLSRDKDDFLNRCTRVESIANIIGCKVRVLSNLQKEAYQQISPTYPQIKQITDIASRAFPVSTFVGGFPFASAGFNDGSGYYLGKDSDGGIILLDLWKRDRNRPNSNMTIVGGSGSGKSTAIKHIIASEYARGTKIIVIDPESEYKDGALIAKYHWYVENNRLQDDWFYSTVPDLEESTVLSEKQQKRCINNLAKVGLIRSELRGMPAKRCFYIVQDIDLIQSLLAKGEAIMKQIKPSASANYEKKRKSNSEPNEKTRELNMFLSKAFGETMPIDTENNIPCSAETAKPVSTSCQPLLRQKGVASSAKKADKTKVIKTKTNNLNKSINQSISSLPVCEYSENNDRSDNIYANINYNTNADMEIFYINDNANPVETVRTSTDNQVLKEKYSFQSNKKYSEEDYENSDLAFLNGACGYEFSEAQMKFILAIICTKSMPDYNLPCNDIELTRYNYLMEKYARLNLYATKCKIRDRYRYFVRMLQTDCVN